MANKSLWLKNNLLYKVLNTMKYRCYNEKSTKYKYYGEKGITICDEWLNDFKSFEQWAISNGYKKGLSIDRINPNGNYEPNNCRWATIIEQNKNRSLPVNNTSGYRGVSFDKSRKKWVARVSINNTPKTIGRFEDKIDAAKAYNDYVIENNLGNILNNIA